MKKHLWKLLSLILALALCLGMLPGVTFAADIVASGYCGGEGDGTNLSWTLDSAGTLTISGSGEMADWDNNTTKPWYAYREKILAINIQSGVTGIGKQAFASLSHLKTVRVPVGIRSIREGAFAYCQCLLNIAIPDTVTEIQNNAFGACTSLKSLIIPNGVKEIPRYCFISCRDLESVILPDTIDSIGDSAFYKCPTLDNVKIPNGVSSIDYQVFGGCTSLSNIQLPDSITSIGELSFYNCSSLESISLPDSLSSIQKNAFFNCSSLKQIVLPDGLSLLGNSAFQDCTALADITIPKGITGIGKATFKGCSTLNSITLPGSLMTIDNAAFSGCSKLSDIYWLGYEADWDTVWVGSSNEPFRNAQIHFVSPAPDIVASGICGGEGDGSNLTWTLDSEGTLTISGNGAMKDYSSIHFEVPWCDNRDLVVRVVLASGVTNIGDYAFGGCSNLTSVMIPSGVTNIGKSAFIGCSNLRNVTIPNSVNRIGSYAFSDCSSLTSVTIPNKVTSIEGSAFGSCSSLKEILVSDENTAFCTQKGVLFTKDMKAILQYPAGRDEETYIIPSGITSIGDSAFKGCSSLMKVIIPSSVMRIEANAFYECSGMASLIIPNGVNIIAQNALGHCFNLTTVTIPVSVTQIDAYAFFECFSLKDVYYSGSLDDWNAIKVGWHNEYLQDATLYFEGQSPITCTVTFNANGGSVSPADKTVTQGEAYGELPLPTWTNHSFDGWYTSANGGDRITAETIVNLSANQTLYAHWTYVAPIYTVTFNANGGSVSPVDKTVTQGEAYGELPVPTWTNHSFDGWYTAANGGERITAASIVNLSANQTLYAHWTYTAPIYTVTFNANGGSVSPASKTVTQGEAYGELPVPTWTNHSFGGWYTAATGGEQITAGSIVNLSADQTLYAHWTEIPHKEFTWGRDNWNFNNSSYQGFFASGQMIDQISQSYQVVLAQNLTNTEYDWIFNKKYGWIYDTWGGSCYGMSSLVMLSMNDLLPYSDYKTGATSLNQLSYPKNDKNVSSLITYYQLLQIKDVIQNQYRTVPNRSNETNIKQIISLLNENDTVLLGFKKSGWGGHAILAYGYEYGSYTFNGVTYQGHIKICDPNSSISSDRNYDIYFNTSSYRWIIPAYSYASIDSASGAKFNYIGANINDINAGGYLNGSSNHTSSDFVARIDIAAASQNRSIVKVIESNGNYIERTNASDDIVEDESFIVGGESIGMAGYNLYDTDSSYRVSQSEPVNMELSMDYGTCRLRGKTAAGESIIFDKKGLVEVKSQSAAYELSMVFNDDYPTDWFTIRVSGDNADNVTLEMRQDGYLLSGNNLENITLELSNRSDSASATFTTNYPSALIYELDKNTIGVSVDSDANGTYETVIVDGSTPPTVKGDVDGDGKLTYDDARAVFHFTSGDASALTDTGAADINGDGKVNNRDAILLFRKSAGQK